MTDGTTLWERYQKGLQYQRQMHFDTLFPECVRFKEGDQWPAPTKKTRHMPRPVYNYIDFFIRTKKANVLNQVIKLVYSPAEGDDPAAEEGAKQYSDYAASLWKELRQDDLNDQMVDDAATLGTGILHYYWDNDVSGGVRLPYQGALRGESLDPLTVFVANPQLQEIQKQEWVMIAQRYTVDSVRALARSLGFDEQAAMMIAPDEERAEQYDAERHEMDGEKKCTLLTMYYRKNGRVYFDRGTRSVTLIEGQSLTPGGGMEGASEGLPDVETPEPDPFEELPQTPGMTLYPVVLMPWQLRKRCIFGIGEAQGLIPAQKTVNFLMAMNALAVQDAGWPKMLVRENALRQPVTNEPGEIIRDYSLSGDGIKYLNPPSFSAFAANLVDKISDMMRTVSGVSEVASGEPFSATMAASAIIALQNQAKKPIEDIQRRFYRAIEQAGRIWEQFFKYYYSMPRPYKGIGPDGKEATGAFTGSDFAGVEFALEADVSIGSDYSESLAMATLDKLFDSGNIDLDTYIELAPKTVMPFKERLRQIRETQAAMTPAIPQGTAQLPGAAAQGSQPATIREGAAPYGVELPGIPNPKTGGI